MNPDFFYGKEQEQKNGFRTWEHGGHRFNGFARIFFYGKEQELKTDKSGD
jgi:hypothetical protein